MARSLELPVESSSQGVSEGSQNPSTWKLGNVTASPWEYGFANLGRRLVYSRRTSQPPGVGIGTGLKLLDPEAMAVRDYARAQPRLPRKVKLHVTKVSRLPRKMCGDNPHPSASPEPTQCHKCHTCHAKCKLMSPSAMPASQSEGPCHQVPHLPCKVGGDNPHQRVTRTNPVP